MRNSTSTRLHTNTKQRISRKHSIAVLLLLSAFYGMAQSHLPAGVKLPATPTAAPQQFTTNLIAVNTNRDTTVDGNIAVLDNSFSNAVDNSDGLKVINAEENFGLIRNSIDLVLEARKQVITTDTLFYKMTNLNIQNYKLEFFPINMTKPGLTAVLVDRFLGTRTAVSLSTAPTYYPFSVTANAGSFAQDRFILILFQADPGPLPVDFISIAAAKNSTGVQVSWKVAGERGIINYSIERSADARTFSSVGTVTAAGSGYVDKDITYSWKDNSALNSIQYYRIKSNGVNKEAKYSPIVKLGSGSIKSSISVLSNPVKGNSINLQLTKVPKGKYEVNLSGTDGKLIFTKLIQHAGESATYPVSLPATVSKGTYVLSVISPDRARQSQVLMIDQSN
jgi:hypothetical protein